MDEKKLLNILKLKEAFEKELEKKGKLKKTVKKKTEKKQPSVKLKIDVGPPAMVDASAVNTILDINRQDYDASDSAVVKALKKTLNKVGNIKKRLLIEGIIDLLNGDHDKALEVFGRFADDEFRYMKGVALLYKGDPNVIEYAVKFLRDRSTNYLPYILMAEVLLSYEKYKDAVKFFSTAAKISKDPYFLLMSSVYNDDQLTAKKLFPYCVNKGGYKLLVAILSIFTDMDSEKADKLSRSLIDKENACCKYHALYWSSYEISKEDEKFPFCSRIKFMKVARQVYNGEMDSIPVELMIYSDPLKYLLSGIYEYNRENYGSADEHFKSFSENVEFLNVEFIRQGAKTVKVFGMQQFFKYVYGDVVHTVSELSSKVLNESLEFLVKEKKFKKEELDLRVKFKDPEFLKMLFGQRHCKFIYSE